MNTCSILPQEQASEATDALVHEGHVIEAFFSMALPNLLAAR